MCIRDRGYGIARPMPADEVLAWVDGFDLAPTWQAAAGLPPIVSLHGQEPAGGTAQIPLFVQ